MLMTTEKVKTMSTVVNELGESYSDLLHSLKETTTELRATKKLWRNENKSPLIKIGLALIAFPDPTISDVLGSLLVAAGTVQMGIKRRCLYADDIFKTFKKTLEEVQDIKCRVE